MAPMSGAFPAGVLFVRISTPPKIEFEESLEIDPCVHGGDPRGGWNRCPVCPATSRPGPHRAAAANGSSGVGEEADCLSAKRLLATPPPGIEAVARVSRRSI